MAVGGVGAAAVTAREWLSVCRIGQSAPVCHPQSPGHVSVACDSLPAPEQCRLRRGRLGVKCDGHNRHPRSLNDAVKIWMTICSCDLWGSTMIKMRNVTIMFAMMGAITSSAHGQITININTNNNRQAISPYVYG